MANPSITMPARQNLTSAQGAAKPVLSSSFEATPVTIGAGETLNVEGAAYVFLYGGGAVTVSDDGTTFVALEGPTGVAVVVTTARLVDVRGVRFIKTAASSVAVVTG